MHGPTHIKFFIHLAENCLATKIWMEYDPKRICDIHIWFQLLILCSIHLSSCLNRVIFLVVVILQDVYQCFVYLYVKVKSTCLLSPSQFKRMDSGKLAPRIFNLDTRWTWVIRFTNRQLHLQGKNPWNWIHWRMCGPQTNLDTVYKAYPFSWAGNRLLTPRMCWNHSSTQYLSLCVINMTVLSKISSHCSLKVFFFSKKKVCFRMGCQKKHLDLTDSK